MEFCFFFKQLGTPNFHVSRWRCWSTHFDDVIRIVRNALERAQVAPLGLLHSAYTRRHIRIRESNAKAYQ